jgi:magnesium transporter
MTAMVRKRSEKAGLPPGALVYVGDKSGEDATITLMEYDGDTFSEQSLRDLPVCPPERDRACVTWIEWRSWASVTISIRSWWKTS